MKPSHLLLTLAVSLAAALPAIPDARAQGKKSGVEMLYIWINHDSQMSPEFYQ